MRFGTARATLWLSVLILGLFLPACGKGYRQIAVVNEGNVELVTFGPPPKEAQEVWVPGRVLVFRTDSSVPGAPIQATGTAGRVYRLNDKLEMEEIDQFDLSIPNDTLAYRFGG